MSDPGLHVERTALAWSRTWLAATVGVALSLRLVADHGTWLLVVVTVLVVALSLAAAAATSAAGPARAAVLAVTAISIGLVTMAAVVLRMVQA